MTSNEKEITIINDPDIIIELKKADACFNPGDNIDGHITIRISKPIEIYQLILTINGLTCINPDCKKDKSVLTSKILFRKKLLLVQSAGSYSLKQQEKHFPFKIQVPYDSPTSLETKHCFVRYMLRATLTCHIQTGETEKFISLKGISVVEILDLNILKSKFFKTSSVQCSRKFGFFFCTGGQIKLLISIPRSAFVPGEYIPFEGRIDNKSYHRVEKISATLRQIVVYPIDEEDMMSASDIHEENIALYVDVGRSLNIMKNFHIPAVPPSTAKVEFFGKSGDERSSVANEMQDLRHSDDDLKIIRTDDQVYPINNSIKGKSFKRTIMISYEIVIRIKSAGLDVQGKIPIIIGTVPSKIHLSTSDSIYDEEMQYSDLPIYQQKQTDKLVTLFRKDEKYACNKTWLTFVNKYPYFTQLPTSSKQSRKTRPNRLNKSELRN